MTRFEEERDAVQKQIAREENELLVKYKQRQVISDDCAYLVGDC